MELKDFHDGSVRILKVTVVDCIKVP